MTAGVVHATNLTPPGSECNPPRRVDRGAREAQVRRRLLRAPGLEPPDEHLLQRRVQRRAGGRPRVPLRRGHGRHDRPRRLLQGGGPCTAVECTAVECTAVECTAVECTAVESSRPIALESAW
jgi:hypothetical protein